MALWMGPGRKVFERAWERPSFALDLCGTLSNLGWGGWKLIALPHVIRSVPQLLQSHPSKVLALLSILRNDGRLDGVDSAWKQRLQSWVDIRFREWKGTEEQVSPYMYLYYTTADASLDFGILQCYRAFRPPPKRFQPTNSHSWICSGNSRSKTRLCGTWCEFILGCWIMSCMPCSSQFQGMARQSQH